MAITTDIGRTITAYVHAIVVLAAFRIDRVATMRVAMLTGGGDCPGLNAVMRAVVRKAENAYGDEVVGLRDGWRGAVEGDLVDLSVESFRGTLPRGGTIIGSSRTNPYKVDGGAEAVKATLADNGIDALVAIGGEDTLGVAARLTGEGVPVVGVPKTIDNDLSATELTFGFDTAVQVCVDAIDRLHTTAESHNRVLIVEVMGRHAGHIATWSAIAGGATMVLVPERPFDIDEVCQVVKRRHERGRHASIVVVAEGSQPVEGTLALQSGDVDEFGHVRLGGIGDVLARAIEERTGYETRATVLGHVQRGGTPTAFDRVLATRFGIDAIDAVHAGDFGKMVALRAGSIVRVPLDEATAELKLVDPALYEVAEVFFG
jgi:ATP-dependent phosphofructokinase / diphosphate-dependent phosphofructokinase